MLDKKETEFLINGVTWEEGPVIKWKQGEGGDLTVGASNGNRYTRSSSAQL